MSIDLLAALRRRKPEKRGAQLAIRPSSNVVGVSDIASSGRVRLVIDTTVYIDSAAGKLPTDANSLIDDALLFHCSVCLAEIAVGIANYDPKSRAWAGTAEHYVELFSTIPETRLLLPDEATWVDAGLLAGTLSRTQHFQAHQRKECLNDALIFLTAAKAGLPVLTANRYDYDLIQQLAPEGQFIHYQPTSI